MASADGNACCAATAALQRAAVTSVWIIADLIGHSLHRSREEIPYTVPSPKCRGSQRNTVPFRDDTNAVFLGTLRKTRSNTVPPLVVSTTCARRFEARPPTFAAG